MASIKKQSIRKNRRKISNIPVSVPVVDTPVISVPIINTPMIGNVDPMGLTNDGKLTPNVVAPSVGIPNVGIPMVIAPMVGTIFDRPSNCDCYKKQVCSAMVDSNEILNMEEAKLITCKCSIFKCYFCANKRSEMIDFKLNYKYKDKYAPVNVMISMNNQIIHRFFMLGAINMKDLLREGILTMTDIGCNYCRNPINEVRFVRFISKDDYSINLYVIYICNNCKDNAYNEMLCLVKLYVGKGYRY